VLSTKTYRYGDELKKENLGWLCRSNGRMRNSCSNLVGKAGRNMLLEELRKRERMTPMKM